MTEQFCLQCDDFDDNESDENVLSHILPTPMALRDISNKAQQSLASLYSDSPNDSNRSSEEEAQSFTPKKLFDDESEDITS
jgi:hypothetical protein